MKTTYCNPLDLGYRYSHMNEGIPRSHREGADPTLIFFKGTYYAFVSMSAGFWHSRDLLNWEFHADSKLLIYDYAPDVRQIGDSLFFCASRWDRNCPILRTRDPLREPFAEVSAPFPFWDPDLFQDDDGRVFLYWGCSNTTPIYGVEMNPETMVPMGTPQALIFDHPDVLGYERPGEDGQGSARPYIEGPFMTKHGGKYYLQYACPGTEFPTYADGVYVADAPLGPFSLQCSNPYSSKPGGFITGAGHGSTIADAFGNFWHAATMRISVNHIFERRIGLFPAGFDRDGILYCNQNFADYPHEIPAGKLDAAAQQPKWMLLSYGKKASASSGRQPGLAVNENIRDWWSADTAQPGQWLQVDLGRTEDVRAVQVNFADEGLTPPVQSYETGGGNRVIELEPQLSCYAVEWSGDGESWQIFEKVARECVNGYHERPEGIPARYIRVTVEHLPYGQPARISGLRVFGNGSGKKCPPVKAQARRISPLEAVVSWQKPETAQGCNVRYGIAPEKLYLSWLVYGGEEITLTTLIQGQEYYVCVDSFNETGITPGQVIRMEDCDE